MDKSSPIQALCEAVLADKYPTGHPTCLKTFLFDSVSDWPQLFGLYKCILTRPDADDHIATLTLAAEKRQVVKGILEVADKDPELQNTPHWSWFQKKQSFLSSLEDPGPPVKGSRVLLGGLTGAADLNGAVGQIAGDQDPDTGRYPVMLRGPVSAVNKYPDGVKVKPANMETLLPPTATLGVGVHGFDVWPAYTFEVEPGASLPSSWQRAPVPEKLGYPLVMKQLAKNKFIRPSNEMLATYMMADAVSGFAPPHIQMHGLGPVIFVRRDGLDFTADEIWKLHDYNSWLMDVWGGDPEYARESLTPQAFQAFTMDRAGEEWDEADD